MWRHLPAEDPLLPYAARLETPDFGNQVLRGYLTGSVDLLFRRGGRHFVVDHKTNWLGAPESELTVDDYAPDRLAAAMTHTSYPLQAPSTRSSCTVTYAGGCPVTTLKRTSAACSTCTCAEWPGRTPHE